MTADYDLSQLETSQANLWILLQADVIRAEILADQSERLAFTYFGRPHHHDNLSEASMVVTVITGACARPSARQN
ncbi:MAG: hypothetical protein ACRD18_11525 [Terriglobia bacterium]